MNKSLLTFSVALILSACTNKQANIEAENKPLVSGVEFQNMDHSIRPQDDFYRFVNGQWLNDFQLPEDKAYYGNNSSLVDKSRAQVKAIINEVSTSINETGSDEQKIADLYKTFMDVDAIESKGLSSLADEIARIDNITNNTDLSEYMAYANVFSNAPFGFYVYLDDKNSTEHIIYVYQSGLGLPDRDYYFKDDDKSKNIQGKYVAHIGNMLKLTGMDDAEERAKTIYALEKALAAGHWDRIKNDKLENTYNKMSFADFSATVPSIDWDAWLKHTMVDKPETLVVEQPSYFETINQVMKDTPLDAWKDYYKWHLLSNFAKYLTPSFENESFAFYGTVLSGTTEQEPRWKRAVDLVNGTAGELVGKVYVKRHFSAEAKTRVIDMVKNIRSALGDSINQSAWMDEITQVKAHEKLARIDVKIGYPDVWRDYSKMVINDTDLVANKKESRRFYTHRSRSKLGQPLDRTVWWMNPQTVNASYTPSMNEILFPAGILQPPYFNLHADDAINYGGIGSIIGHEMGHGFDDSGSKFDADGNRVDWWTAEDHKQFKQRTAQLLKQYNAFTVVDGTHVIGELTQGENISDLSGLSIAFKAFKANYKGDEVIDGYTPEQRFFIGWAQIRMRKYRDEFLLLQIETNPHAPAEFRINGVLRNMPEFYQAFDVEPGDAMYLPEDQRVKIW